MFKIKYGRKLRLYDIIVTYSDGSKEVIVDGIASKTHAVMIVEALSLTYDCGYDDGYNNNDGYNYNRDG